VRPDDRRIDQHGLQIGVVRHPLEQPRPHAQIGPARKALVDTILPAILRRQEAPLCPALIDPADRLQEPALPLRYVRVDPVLPLPQDLDPLELVIPQELRHRHPSSPPTTVPPTQESTNSRQQTLTRSLVCSSEQQIGRGMAATPTCVSMPVSRTP
jgi:hypothetical protein